MDKSREKKMRIQKTIKPIRLSFRIVSRALFDCDEDQKKKAAISNYNIFVSVERKSNAFFFFFAMFASLSFIMCNNVYFVEH